MARVQPLGQDPLKILLTPNFGQSFLQGGRFNSVTLQIGGVFFRLYGMHKYEPHRLLIDPTDFL